MVESASSARRGSRSPPMVAVDEPSPGAGTVRLAKYLAHAGIASRRAAEQLIASGRVSVDGETVTDPARDVGERSAVALDGTPARRARAAGRLRAAQARRRGLNGARHARQADRGRAGTGRRAAPVSGWTARRRQQRPDPADQRRRARQPAHAPPLRGAEDLSRARRGRAGRSRCARRAFARAWSSTTAPPRPRGCGALPGGSSS